MNKFLKILGIAVGVIVLATLIMAIFQICPPSGPWPMPPWCKAGMQLPDIKLPETKIPASSSTSTSSSTLNFNVKIPENTPTHSVIYLEMLEENGEGKGSFKMEKTGRNTWSLKENPDKYKTKEIAYRYNRGNWGFVGAEEFSPDSKTANRKVLVDEKTREINDTIEKWRWFPEPGYEMPIILANAGKVAFKERMNSEKFQKGALFVDFWWGNFKDLLDITHARLKEKGFQWIEIAPPWDYKQVNPVPIITYEGFGHTYPDDTLDIHLSKMKEDGFKVYMMPQICCTDTSKAGFSKEWWDEWFNEYEKYAMYFVDKANKHNVEYLVISGDWVAVAASPDKRSGDYKARLDAIYTKVKSAYKGKLGRNLFIGGEIGGNIPDVWPNPDDIPFIEQADFIGINWWVGLTDKNNPTQEELNANAKRIFDLRLKPLYEKYKKPIILQQVAYPSIDGGLTGKAGVDDAATALWEPYSGKYNLDLEEQAMGFEAIMNAVADSPYVIGVYPFTYWPDEFPLSKEYNIRGKPAEEVLSQWYKTIS